MKRRAVFFMLACAVVAFGCGTTVIKVDGATSSGSSSSAGGHGGQGGAPDSISVGPQSSVSITTDSVGVGGGPPLDPRSISVEWSYLPQGSGMAYHAPDDTLFVVTDASVQCGDPYAIEGATANGCGAFHAVWVTVPFADLHPGAIIPIGGSYDDAIEGGGENGDGTCWSSLEPATGNIHIDNVGGMTISGHLDGTPDFPDGFGFGNWGFIAARCFVK